MAVAETHNSHGQAKLRALAVAALGIVFGDIGTSPLYAFKECVTGKHGVSPTHENVLGILSLIVYSITLVVALKYLTFVMRADNRGEGGILALLALVPEKFRSPGPRLGWLAVVVLFGAALLYGDGIITPAISVLSAMEGLEVATDSLKPWVVPITCLILLGLFAIQKRGTAGVGRLFGPVMVVWFFVLAGLGIRHIVDAPQVLHALSPVYAVRFFIEHGFHGIVVLGSVVLTITGGEALYADMGHFGRSPIRLSWYGLVMPSLLLNYFGQGALLLANPAASANPFYGLVPAGHWTYALVVLSTLATIIASQALISGAYSLTHQAVQLGYFPRVTIQHTSSETEGQIYIPEINWALALACIGLVLAFEESSRLAAAYGIAVTGTMGITSIAYFMVIRQTWKWPLWKAAPLLVFFLSIDLPFFAANMLKFFDGGFVPIIVAAGIFLMMANWKVGRAYLSDALKARGTSVEDFLAKLKGGTPIRVDGSAVFLASDSKAIPSILQHHVRHNRVLHRTVVLLTIVTEHIPKVEADNELEYSELGEGVFRIIGHYGFVQSPNVPTLLQSAIGRFKLPMNLEDTTYYIGRETFLATDAGRMRRLAETLFSFVSRNARTASSYFSIPGDRVVELGLQIDL